MLQRVMSQIAAVKKDMIILEKSEFSALLAESEVNVHGPWIHIHAALILIHITKDFKYFSYFSQKLKIQLLQLKVHLAVSYSYLLKSVYIQVFMI